MNIQDWFPWGLTGLISLQSKGLSRVFSSTAVRKHHFSDTQTSLWSNVHIHTWLLDKPLLWQYGTLSEKWYLCFLIRCLGCHSFPSKEQPSFNFMAAVTIFSDFGAQENKVSHCSVQFSLSGVSDSLWPHEPQHSRPPCPSPIPRVHPNTCPLSWWCHPTISFSVILFSSCPQSFPASECLQMSQLFVSGRQSIGVSASTSELPMNNHDSSPLGWTGWISLQSKGLSFEP